MEQNELWELMTTVDQTDPMSTQLMLRESYETTFGIRDHDNLDVPMQAAAFNEAELVNEHSALYKEIRKFINLDIYKSTGMSMTEYLELPRDICELVKETILEAHRKTKEQLDGDTK